MSGPDQLQDEVRRGAGRVRFVVFFRYTWLIFSSCLDVNIKNITHHIYPSTSQKVGEFWSRKAESNWSDSPRWSSSRSSKSGYVWIDSFRWKLFCLFEGSCGCLHVLEMYPVLGPRPW